MNCRHCEKPLEHIFLDLGFAPPSNAYLQKKDLLKPENHFPLKLYVCEKCWLVQTEDYVRSDVLFGNDYAYFSSISQSWCNHAADYVEMISKRLSLGPESFVLEIGSNDGYLLINFVTRRIPCLGIEPTKSTAMAAKKIGVPVLSRFFGVRLAKELADSGKKADLIIGNNVYAHVQDINDFTTGLKTVLKPGGTITLEFPHLLRLIEKVQFDTVYHEHYSYLSLYTVDRLFSSVGLRIFYIEELGTHGGSLRVYGCHTNDRRSSDKSVSTLINEEERLGLRCLSTYHCFQRKVNKIKNDFLTFLIEAYRSGKNVCAYGAAAKGNTFLNYAGIRPDLLSYVVDRNPAKQGHYMPGSHIPIYNEYQIKADKPDFVILLPWNLKDEIIIQLDYIRQWGGKLVVAVPSLELI